MQMACSVLETDLVGPLQLVNLLGGVHSHEQEIPIPEKQEHEQVLLVDWEQNDVDPVTIWLPKEQLLPEAKPSPVQLASSL
jgi:hypothetical protein